MSISLLVVPLSHCCLLTTLTLTACVALCMSLSSKRKQRTTLTASCSWTLSKTISRHSQLRETLQFLLDHPRRCFIYLFPAQ